MAKLHVRDLASVNHLRQLPGAELAESRDEVWLRGNMVEDAPPAALARLPLLGLYHWVEERLLAPLGSSVPSCRFPAGLVWKPVSEWFQPQVETRALPAGLEVTQAQIRLIRGGSMREPNVMRLPLETFAAWVQTAPEIRLSPLKFACSEDGEVLVRGIPLPPLPGQQYFETAGIALPAGWQWDPPLPAKALAGALGLRPDDLALLEPQAAIERIPASHFVTLTRAAVRLSPTDFPSLEEEVVE